MDAKNEENIKASIYSVKDSKKTKSKTKGNTGKTNGNTGKTFASKYIRTSRIFKRQSKSKTRKFKNNNLFMISSKLKKK
jgi:hypothetical protein